MDMVEDAQPRKRGPPGRRRQRQVVVCLVSFLCAVIVYVHFMQPTYRPRPAVRWRLARRNQKQNDSRTNKNIQSSVQQRVGDWGFGDDDDTGGTPAEPSAAAVDLKTAADATAARKKDLADKAHAAAVAAAAHTCETSADTSRRSTHATTSGVIQYPSTVRPWKKDLEHGHTGYTKKSPKQQQSV
jgi:hypothetical protein